MLGDWKCDCRSRTWVDSALAGSQALASFFSAPISFPDSGKATTTTTSHKPTTSHLVQLPAGISAILLNLLTDSPGFRWQPLPSAIARYCLRPGRRSVHNSLTKPTHSDHWQHGQL